MKIILCLVEAILVFAIINKDGQKKDTFQVESTHSRGNIMSEGVRLLKNYIIVIPNMKIYFFFLKSKNYSSYFNCLISVISLTKLLPKTEKI